MQKEGCWESGGTEKISRIPLGSARAVGSGKAPRSLSTDWGEQYSVYCTVYSAKAVIVHDFYSALLLKASILARVFRVVLPATLGSNLGGYIHATGLAEFDEVNLPN